MKINKFLFILLIIIILNSSPILAWFPHSHAYISLVSLRTSNTPITNLCAGRENLIITGMFADDVFVVHYLEGGTKITSYIGSHSKGFYERWMQLAGSDKDLKCMGYGIGGFHQVQDQETHYVIVPEDIMRYKLPNIIVHPAREQQLEQSMLKDLQENGDPYKVTSYGEVVTITQNSLDIFDTNPKYLATFSKATGLKPEDIKRDIDTVNINLKGNSWDEAVYGKRVYLPTSYIIWLLILLAIPILSLYLTYKIGRNSWKFLAYFLHGLFAVIIILAMISVPLGTSWKWYQYANSVPVKLISNVDYKPHVDKSIAQTKLFLQDEILRYKDASGLSYTEGDRKIDGALTKADKKVRYFVIPLVAIILIVLNALLFWIMSRGKSKTKSRKFKPQR